MSQRLNSIVRILSISAGAAGLLLQSGCRLWPFGDAGPEPPPPPRTSPGLSFYEQRVQRVYERADALNTDVETDRVDEQEARRRFMEICREYEALIADNPDEIETRLLYGKFLNRYGDREGAYSQFLWVYNRHQDIAVVNQQLGTYFAEEGDHTRALAFYLHAAQLEPTQAQYHYDIGQLLFAFEPGLIADGVFTEATLNAEMFDAFRVAAENAPNNLTFQFRYGEAFYDVPDPDWNAALAHWTRLQQHPALSPIQADAVRLHRARSLAELGRLDEAVEILEQVTQPGLQGTRQSLLEQIEAAQEAPN